MKKVVSILLALAMVFTMVFALASCGGKGKEDESSTEAGSKAASGANGQVYYLNFKPEADKAWQKIAADYTAQTGVPVKVVTAASGEYESTLQAEMDKDAAPTMFNIGNQAGVSTWDEYAYDLKDTKFAKELSTDDFNLYDDAGKLVSVGYCYETFGIIVNKALLKKAGHTVDEIKDFDSLKKVADDIHANASTLGFDAFTSSGLHDSSSWRFSGHLANMPLFYEFRDDNVKSEPATIKGTYLDNYKKIWDLYTTDTATTGAAVASATGDQAEAEFGKGQAAFYQNGSWEFSNLTGTYKMNADDLQMIPIYCGVKGEEKAGLCSGTENCWAVNANASEEDIQATLDFMYWMVTSEEGTKMMADQFGPIPFKSAKTPENVFFQDAQKLMDAGNYTVTWAFNYTPNVNTWRAGVVDALTKYTKSGSDSDWNAVKTAFVDGWATQYQAEHAK